MLLMVNYINVYLYIIILYKRYVNDNGGSFLSGIYCIYFVYVIYFLFMYDIKSYMIKS